MEQGSLDFNRRPINSCAGDSPMLSSLKERVRVRVNSLCSALFFLLDHLIEES